MAAPKTYSLSIVTPLKPIFEGSVINMILPGTIGYMEVLINHAPIISSLRPGTLTFKMENGELEIYAISGGFLEFSNNTATILADSVEKPEEIDLARAEEALRKATERLASARKDIDKDRAKRSMQRAENRIKVYKESH